MILKRLLTTFNIVFLLFAAPAYAGWYEQLPDEYQTWNTVKEMRVLFLGDQGAGLIATFTMRDGKCIQFKATAESISHARKCGEEDWAEYIWHSREDLH
jgi:hypothetical protein